LIISQFENLKLADEKNQLPSITAPLKKGLGGSQNPPPELQNTNSRKNFGAIWSLGALAAK
jgi:hypothetical protein